MGVDIDTINLTSTVQPGDVVILRNSNWPEGCTITGRVYLDNREEPHVGGSPIRTMAVCGTLAEFSIVSRAPRPLYVNHPRNRPVPGDVANPGDGTKSVAFHTIYGWMWPNRTTARLADNGLRLLVDGETGEVVSE